VQKTFLTLNLFVASIFISTLAQAAQSTALVKVSQCVKELQGLTGDELSDSLGKISKNPESRISFILGEQPQLDHTKLGTEGLDVLHKLDRLMVG